MTVLDRILNFIEVSIYVVKGFFNKGEKPARKSFRKLDLADIFIALLPAAVFGCLLFGLRAVLVLAVCIAVCLLTDFAWDIIFKKQQKRINYSLILTGLLLGLTLSSRLNIFLVIASAVLTTLLVKTIFKKKPLYIAFPILIARAVLSIVFFKAFSVYALPFGNLLTEASPLVALRLTTSFITPAKYLFFGLHSGNIGETSALLLLIGGIYLIIRKIVNPIVPACFIVTVGVLSLIFGQSISISLMGDGLFLAALFLTMDIGFCSAPRYKKFLYGLLCGVLTFVFRFVLYSQAVFCAVLIANLVVFYLNRKNIARVVKFVKKFKIKKYLKKIKKVFSV